METLAAGEEFVLDIGPEFLQHLGNGVGAQMLGEFGGMV
jgi:hypothetical protein